MRIVIDLQGAQSIGSRNRGFGRYSMALALGIARNRGDHEVLIALNALFPDTIDPICAAFKGLLPRANIRLWSAAAPVFQLDPANAWRREAGACLREDFLASLQPDAVLVTSLFEGYADNIVTGIGVLDSRLPTAVILYDLIPWIYQKPYLDNPRERAWYEDKLAHLRRATQWLAISESSRQEGLQHLNLPADAVVNISGAADPQFVCRDIPAPQADALRRQYSLQRPFLMYTGGLDHRKNIDGLIRAYATLPGAVRSAHQLAVVCSVNPENRYKLEQLATSCGLAPGELVLTGFVPDQDLVALYQLCKAFVFPSWHEGFGLPVLEAMHCGAPVIAAGTSSLPEVVGCEEALFDPRDEPAMAQKILQILVDDTFRQRLRAHGAQQAQKFSWDITAQRAIAALEAMSAAQPSAYTAAPGTQRVLQAIARLPTAVVAPTEADLCATAAALTYNAGNPAGQQLLLDVSTIIHSDAKSGIQRVVRSLLGALLSAPPPGVQVRPIYFDQGRYRYANGLGGPHESSDAYADFFDGDIYLALDLNLGLAAQLHPQHAWMRACGVDLFFIVYDILLLRRPDWWPASMAAVFQQWLQLSSQVATGLICISDAVAQDVGDWLRSHPPQRSPGMGDVRIHSFHLGADIQNSAPSRGMPDSAAAVLAALQARTSFLMVGTIEPRKGHAQTLAAFEQLWQRGVAVNLVLVGKSGWMVEALEQQLRQHPQNGQHLFWLEGISDEYLEQVYQACACLLASSEGEGFGLPLIEAAQHHLPIVARDLLVFREVAGAHAYYFDGLTPHELAAAIERWLALHASGQHPPSHAMPWLTWQASAAQLLQRLLPVSTAPVAGI